MRRNIMFKRLKKYIIFCIVLVMVAALVGCGGGKDRDIDSQDEILDEQQDMIDEEEDAVSKSEFEELEPQIKDREPKEEPKEKETVSQKNAVRKAKDYLNYTSFSRKGLIEQLEFEGFSIEDATYAIDKLNVNWKEQAIKKAKDYLDYTAFSRTGLI